MTIDHAMRPIGYISYSP